MKMEWLVATKCHMRRSFLPHFPLSLACSNSAGLHGARLHALTGVRLEHPGHKLSNKSLDTMSSVQKLSERIYALFEEKVM